MKRNLSVDVHHVARIEGHGNIQVRITNGTLEEARWDVVETPRFFEAMLKGRHWSTAAQLAARICGICSISHCLTSLRATERAMGVTAPGAATQLRLLAKHAETLQSHVLHLFFLAAPDFLGVPSVLELGQQHPTAVALALRLRGLANRLSDAVAGRTTHPTALAVGGVTAVPNSAVLSGLRNELGGSLADLEDAVGLFATIEVPGFERETEFVSLKGEDHYPFIGGAIMSSDGAELGEDRYLEATNEYLEGDNTSKWTRWSRDSYAVGALARFNNNHHLLHPEAARVAARLGLDPVCHNPFMCNLAQLVECVHCTHDAIRIIDELAAAPSGELQAPVEPRAGDGVGAVEAPRGILFHHYAYDQGGRIASADCVVPSTQNNGNIHRDLPSLVTSAAARGADDAHLEQLCCMLVRAYDPCLSCSVH